MCTPLLSTVIRYGSIPLGYLLIILLRPPVNLDHMTDHGGGGNHLIFIVWSLLKRKKLKNLSSKPCEKDFTQGVIACSHFPACGSSSLSSCAISLTTALFMLVYFFYRCYTCSYISFSALLCSRDSVWHIVALEQEWDICDPPPVVELQQPSAPASIASGQG